MLEIVESVREFYIHNAAVSGAKKIK